MIRVTTSEFKKLLGAMSDAVPKEPIMITKQDRDLLVVLAADEYQRLKQQDCIVDASSELTDKWLEPLKTLKKAIKLYQRMES